MADNELYELTAEIEHILLSRKAHHSLIFSELSDIKRGKEYSSATCPFCQEAGKFRISDTKALSSCYRASCTWQGWHNWHEYRQARGRSVSWLDFYKELAKEAGVAWPEASKEEQEKHKSKRQRARLLEAAHEHFTEALWTPQGQPVLSYLEGRGYSHEEIKAMRLGAYVGWPALRTALSDYSQEEIEASELLSYGPAGCRVGETHPLMMLWTDKAGRPLGMQGRAILSAPELESKGWPKYLYSKGMRRSSALPGLETARGAEELILVESPLAALYLNTQGLSQPVLAMGGTSLSNEQLKTIQQAGAKRLFLALDNDSSGAGQKATKRLIDKLKETGLQIWITSWQGSKGPDDLAQEQGLEALQSALKGSERVGSWIAKYLASQYELDKPESRELELARMLDRAAEIYDTWREEPAEKQTFIESLSKHAQIHPDYVFPELYKAYIRNREREQAQAFEGLLSRARRTAEEQGLTAARIALREGLAEQSLLSGATLPEPYLLAQALQDMLQAPPALDMGYESLSEFVSIPRAALSTVAAPSGQGKTTFMLNLLANWLDMPKHEDESFYFYTYEEPARAIALKLIMIWAGVERAAHSNYEAYLNYLKYHRGENEQIEAAIAKYERLSSSGRLYIIPAELDNEGLAAELSLIAKRGQVGAMLIDYIQLIPALRQAATRQLELQRTSQLLRDVARDSEIAVIVGSQLNEEGRVREARDIYQESALVLQLRSKAEDNGETPDMSVYVDKQRGGVSGVTKYLTFERPILKISDKLAARLEPMAEPEQTGLRF